MRSFSLVCRRLAHLDDAVGRPRIAEHRARLRIRVVGERGGRAGPLLYDKLEARRRQLADGLRHERDPPLAFGCLAGDPDPHS